MKQMKQMKQMKKVISIFCMVLLMLVVPAQIVSAAKGTPQKTESNDDPQGGPSMSNTEEDTMNIANPMMASSLYDPYTGQTYIHNTRFANSTMQYGIDVSSHNGEIKWNSVKASGISKVMIRAGYRGYGSAGTLNVDTNFQKNIQGAISAGLEVGVYFFSQAITEQEAADEANYVLNIIRGYDITLPVTIDYEYASTSSGLGGRLYNANLGVPQATANCVMFCETIAGAGYTPMIYANRTMFEHQLDSASLEKRYKIWLANYTTNTEYTGMYDVWQYSSNGSVNGVSGKVDCSFWYSEPDTVYQGVDYAKVYDYEYYINHNQDVKNALGGDKRKTIAHFVNRGMAEGRQACADFNVYTYKNRYLDLQNAFGNDLKKYYMHYIDCGAAEGRSGSDTADVKKYVTVYDGTDYSAVYNYHYYISAYGDLKIFANNDSAALEHFVNRGMSEGRQACKDFDVQVYKNRYSDLRSAFGDNLKEYYLHYINRGIKEGRSGSNNNTSEPINYTTVYGGVDYSSVYDYTYYINRYSDLQAVFGKDDKAAIQHFVERGMSEGRQGSLNFDVHAYRNRYKDLNSAFGDDWKSYYLHYMGCGKNEGRIGTSEVNSGNQSLTIYNGTDYSDVYNYEYYINQYSDLKTAFGNDAHAALQHFVERGMSEGRQGNNDFNVYAYRKRYKDLEQAFGDDLRSYYLHYMGCGKKEGRSGSL